MNNLQKKKTCVWSLLTSLGYGFISENPFSRTANSLRIINLFCKIACQKCPIIFCFLNKNKNKILPVSEMVKYCIFILFVLVKTERTFFFFNPTYRTILGLFCDLVVNYFYFLLLKVLKNSVHVPLLCQYIFLVCS